MLEPFSHSTSHFFFFFFTFPLRLYLILVPIVWQKNYKVTYLLRQLIFSSNNNVWVVDNLNCSSWTQRWSFPMMRREAERRAWEWRKSGVDKRIVATQFSRNNTDRYRQRNESTSMKGKTSHVYSSIRFSAATFNYLATISTRSCFRVESSLHLSRRNGGVYGQSSTITLILHTEIYCIFTLCVT